MRGVFSRGLPRVNGSFLGPGSTLAQMLSWAKAKVDSMDFVLVFEPELNIDLAAFLDYDEHATFREMVQHYANRFGS